VIPLPKRFELTGKFSVPVQNLVICASSEGGAIHQHVLEELVETVASITGKKPRVGTSPANGEFPIFVGRISGEGQLLNRAIPLAAELTGLPNADQGYVIEPLEPAGIAIAALSEVGVFYGVKTFGQLLEGGEALWPEVSKNSLQIPAVKVLDWPDLPERGQWGGSSVRDIQYLADRKMNLIEAHCQFWIDDAGRGRAAIDTDSQPRALKHAIRWIPIITHLDHLKQTGIFDRFPECRGQGPTAQWRSSANVMAACFSQPKTAELLADWFGDLAAFPGVEVINVWLSEIEGVYCSCPSCKEQNQYVLETKAAVRAWELARQRLPHIRLRILLTQGSYPSNDRVLASVPPEVGITYYCGRRTYDSSQHEMIYPLLAEYAARGGWLGCYPQLTASWRIVCPWSGPQFIKYRMTEFVEKKLQCLCGYATPDNRYYDFNVTAAAEWSWNSRGRDEREFAAAWATRRRLSDPEKAADWAVMLGQIGWDVYASRVPYPQFFGAAARLIARREPPETLKQDGMFRHFPDLSTIDAKLVTSRRAAELAHELGDPALQAETEVIEGYVRMIRSLYVISETVAGKETLEEHAKQTVAQALAELMLASNNTAQALERWHDIVAPDDRAPRFTDTVNVTRQTAIDVAKSLATLGIEIPQ